MPQAGEGEVCVNIREQCVVDRIERGRGWVGTLKERAYHALQEGDTRHMRRLDREVEKQEAQLVSDERELATMRVNAANERGL